MICFPALSLYLYEYITTEINVKSMILNLD